MNSQSASKKRSNLQKKPLNGLQKKPDWLQVAMPSGQNYFELLRLLKAANLHTICQAGNCPNIAECFSKKTATFLILGDTCTRNCSYCNVAHGMPSGVDFGEPGRIARAVREMGLKYVVITSVTRDDLDDGGAGVFAETIREIRRESPLCKIEVLIPDFKGRNDSLCEVIEAKPDVIGHNIEVVRRVFSTARPQGYYNRSLDVLRFLKRNGVVTKSGFMVGLGETKKEVFETVRDLHEAVDILTIGQYLQPSKGHLSVAKYYAPKEFNDFKDYALSLGFKHVEAGPLVRSSYHAGDYGNK